MSYKTALFCGTTMYTAFHVGRIIYSLAHYRQTGSLPMKLQYFMPFLYHDSYHVSGTEELMKEWMTTRVELKPENASYFAAAFNNHIRVEKSQY